MNLITKILDLLSYQERKRAGVLVGLILLMAVLDMLGVASILPFIAVLANPQIIETNSFLNKAYELTSLIGVTSSEEFLLFLGIAVFLLLVISLAFKALTTYAQIRFVLMREYSIGKRLIEGYLHQPYSWFLNRHSADLGKTILSEVGAVIGGGMLPLMILLAQGSVAIALLVLLLIVDPLLAVTVGLVLGTFYFGIFLLMSRILGRLGHIRIKANQERFNAIIEAFGAVKEVKVGGLERVFIDRFSISAMTYARTQATSQVISQLPRFFLEAVAFGGLLLVILYLLAQSQSFTEALPIIALYAFAGYRLMPALQQIYSAFTQIRFAGPSLQMLHKDLTSLSGLDKSMSQINPFDLKRDIKLNNISYSYPNSAREVLKNIDLTIQARTTVGFVGSTGSGKTTTIDLVLGLLQPEGGGILVDGNVINESNLRSWQKAIGYVPQQIYLADTTIAENIAFGVESNKIDIDAVQRAAKIANLHDFVNNELPDGYQTKVGERGVRLSGGQRQRIGIARALYHEPQILIFDEATSALDNLTEELVMDAVKKLEHQITIIIIAHRLSTVRDCDQIFLLDHGVLEGFGKYDELIKNNEKFQKMTANYS